MDKKRQTSVSTGLAIGIAIGVGVGVAMDNIGVGIALGVAIGAGIGSTGAFDRDEKRADEASETRASAEHEPAAVDGEDDIEGGSDGSPDER